VLLAVEASDLFVPFYFSFFARFFGVFHGFKYGDVIFLILSRRRIREVKFKNKGGGSYDERGIGAPTLLHVYFRIWYLIIVTLMSHFVSNITYNA